MIKKVDFQRRKQALAQCIDDSLNVFLARQKGGPEYFVNDDAEEAHERAWELLTAEHKQQVWGLSADLYSLVDNEKRTPIVDQPNDQFLAAKIDDAYKKEDWQTLLSYFRLQPGFVDKETLAYMRGRAWEELGFPRVAIAFYDNASRLKPASSLYRYLALNQVKLLGDLDELQRRCERDVNKLSDDAMMHLLVGEFFHDIALNRPELALNTVALEHLDRGFELELKQVVPESVLGSAVATRVFVLENLQRVDDILPFLGRWVERLPNNAELRSIRGMVYLTEDYRKAIADFEAAVQLGTSLALPYLEVAKSRINKGQYDKCTSLCRVGLQLSHRHAELAEFHHLLGLALFEHDKVRSGEEITRAAELAPFNRQIRANERLFREGAFEFSIPTESLRSWDEIKQSRKDIADVMSFH